MKYLSILFFLCLALALYFSFANPSIKSDDNPLLESQNSGMKYLDKPRQSVPLDFSKPFTKSESYIYFDNYKPINKNAYSTEPRYASDDASCTFWLQKYKQHQSGFNKVQRDQACHGLIVNNGIRR
jgi:hypothetical protein